MNYCQIIFAQGNYTYTVELPLHNNGIYSKKAMCNLYFGLLSLSQIDVKQPFNISETSPAATILYSNVNAATKKLFYKSINW